MHRIYVQFAIYLNGENISNRRFSSASPKSFEQVHCLAEMLFCYLLDLLEENGALPNLAHVVVNYLLSKNSEERP